MRKKQQLKKNFCRILSILVITAMTLALAGCKQQDKKVGRESEGVPAAEGLIVAVGDSLTAGLGVAEEESYPARMEKLLAESGLRYRVVNAGISGETSSGVLARIDWIMKLDPDIVILATGANDGLRGIDPELVGRNIEKSVQKLLDHHVIVVLAGMRMMTNLGPDYTASFNGIYPDISDRYPVVFMPFLLEGVAMVKAFNQEDGIHPNGAGYKVIAENITLYVKEAIQSLQRSRSS